MSSEERHQEGGRFFDEWENPPEDAPDDAPYEEEGEWSDGTEAPVEGEPEAEASAPAGVSATELVELNQRFKSGANWFFWIAALSMVNSVLILTGTGWSFVVGLGVTQFIDAIAWAAMNEGEIPRAVAFGVALFFDLIAAAVCVLFGVLCRYRQLWAFWVGMVLYFLDGLILLAFSMWFGFGFHIFVLLGIYSGFRAARRLRALGMQEQVDTIA